MPFILPPGSENALNIKPNIKSADSPSNSRKQLTWLKGLVSVESESRAIATIKDRPVSRNEDIWHNFQSGIEDRPTETVPAALPEKRPT